MVFLKEIEDGRDQGLLASGVQFLLSPGPGKGCLSRKPIMAAI